MNSWKSSSRPACGVAVIRRKCLCVAAQELAELVALGLLQLAAEVMRGHPVRLIHDHQVPVGLIELLLEVVGAGKLVHPRDEQMVPGEDPAVAALRRPAGG